MEEDFVLYIRSSAWGHVACSTVSVDQPVFDEAVVCLVATRLQAAQEESRASCFVLGVAHVYQQFL